MNARLVSTLASFSAYDAHNFSSRASRDAENSVEGVSLSPSVRRLINSVGVSSKTQVSMHIYADIRMSIS